MTSIHLPARELPIPTSISPQAQAALTMGGLSHPPEWPAHDDHEAWRRLIAEQDATILAALAGRVPPKPLSKTTRVIDGVTVYVVEPEGGNDDRVVLNMHGGALVFMGGDACAAMTVTAAGQTGMPTWGVDYRMPPDHPYPAALDDCLTVYCAMLGEYSPDRIVVSGGSAGGNLAAALIVRARDEGVPLPAAVVLGTPEVDLTESGDSFNINDGIDPLLGRLMPVNLLYAGGHDLAHPYLSPLFADLTGFPPTVLTTGTRDLFLSNTVRMHRALRRAGAEAELHVLEAAPHGGFLGMAPEDAEVAADVQRFVNRYCPPR